MKKLDIDRLTRAGVIYFNSKLEMLENLHCKMYRMNTLVSLSTHFHDYYQIWYVSKGEFVHTISNRQYRIRQGDLFLVPPLRCIACRLSRQRGDPRLRIYAVLH